MRACPTRCLSTFVDRLVLLFYGPVSETRTFASKGVKIPRKFASRGERESRVPNVFVTSANRRAVTSRYLRMVSLSFLRYEPWANAEARRGRQSKLRADILFSTER